MKKQLLATFVLMAVAASAHAVSIVGSFALNKVSPLGVNEFINNFGPTGSPTLANADRVNLRAGNNSRVLNGNASGTFGSGAGDINGMLGQLYDFTFNSATYPNIPTAPLLTIGSFTFNLQGWNSRLQSTTSILLTGYGIFTTTLPGYQPTLGTVSISFSKSSFSTNVNYSATFTSSAVPDGGSTVVLLGAAVAACVLLPRRKSV